MRYLVLPRLENHTLVIHLSEIFCTFAVGKSSSKAGDRSNEFHEHFGNFHTPQFIHLGWISSYNRMKIISWGIFTYTILYGFIPLRLENHTLIYVRYIVPLRLENHTLAIYLCEVYHTSAVGKSYFCHLYTWDILYLCGWKIILLPSIYVRYIVPLRLENHTLAIYLCEIYCTPAVGKSYLSHLFCSTSHLFTWDILYSCGCKIIP
jgi:hypothetical protein